MAEVGFYRYISAGELQSIRSDRVIRSMSGVTYFSPDRYDDPGEAQGKLALPQQPDYRLGPLPADERPDFAASPLQPVGYIDSQRPGGGVEGATIKPIYLFAIFDYASGTSSLS